MGPFLVNRADIIWKILARTSCEYWHPPECPFHNHETGCKAADKCLFPHYKVDEQPNGKPKRSSFPNWKESDDKNAVAIVKSVSQLGCVSQDSDALVSQGRKSLETRCRKSWNQSKGTIQSLRYVMRVFGKKGPSLGKINAKVPHQRSPYFGRAKRDWLRGGVYNFTPMSGFVQLLKINNQNRHEMGHQNSACAQKFQRTKKTHSSDAAIRKQRAFDREVQPWAKFMRVGSRLAKSRFEKHLHASIVASHVVNRARDACCPQSLTWSGWF